MIFNCHQHKALETNAAKRKRKTTTVKKNLLPNERTGGSVIETTFMGPRGARLFGCFLQIRQNMNFGRKPEASKNGCLGYWEALLHLWEAGLLGRRALFGYLGVDLVRYQPCVPNVHSIRFCARKKSIQHTGTFLLEVHTARRIFRNSLSILDFGNLDFRNCLHYGVCNLFVHLGCVSVAYFNMCR